MSLEGLPKYAVLDGGMGTEMHERMEERRGYNTNVDKLWSSRQLQTEEDMVRDIHTDFLESGADIIMTNTYKPSVENFMDHLGVSREEALALFIKAATLARQTVEDFWKKNKDTGRIKPLTAGSQCPYGGRTYTASEYTGVYAETTTIETMVEGHRYKTRALIEGGVDILAFETVPVAVEGEVIAQLMKEFPGSKAWVAFSCKDGEHTCHGERFRDAVLTSLQSDEIVGVGVNCSMPDHVTSLLKEIPDVVKQQKRIIVYPNNGQVWEREKKFWYGDTDRPLHTYVAEWLEHGANWIGGCCNVPPAEIANIRAAMKHVL